MMNLKKLFAGKKTYIVSALGVATAGLAVATHQMSPVEGVMAALGACGLGTLRAGSKTDAVNAAVAVAKTAAETMPGPLPQVADTVGSLATDVLTADRRPTAAEIESTAFQIATALIKK